MNRGAVYLVFVLVAVFLGVGCESLVTRTPVETTDPVTGATTTTVVKTLTPAAEGVVTGAVTVAKAVTGPLGIPAGLWDLAIAADALRVGGRQPLTGG